ncbi:MAG: hypothetical protein WC881_00805 [Elusimicrobiota bacterium]
MKRIRADAIAHLSGGVDSKCASAIFARDNPGKKIVLVTYKSAMEILVEESAQTAAELMRKYKNIAAHYIVEIPDATINQLIVKNQFLWQGKAAPGPCGICSSLWLAASIYLHKNFFKGRTIIEGMRLAGLEFRAGHAEMRKYFAQRYGIDVVTPVLFVSEKEKILKLAKKLGLSGAGHQGVCLFRKFHGFEMPRSRNPQEPLSIEDKNRCFKIFRVFQYLLKINGVQGDDVVIAGPQGLL